MPQQSTGATAFGWHQQAQAHTPLSTRMCCLATSFSPREGWGLGPCYAEHTALSPGHMWVPLLVDCASEPQIMYGHVCPSLFLC